MIPLCLGRGFFPNILLFSLLRILAILLFDLNNSIGDDMDRDSLSKMLLDIDEEAWLIIGEQFPKPRVIIVGGAAFILRDLTSRVATHDVDVYQSDEAVREILSRYPNLNGSVSAYCDQIPYNFEDRLVVLDIGAKTIEFVTPSVEDLVVMKLYAERPNDIQDIDNAMAKGAASWDLLEKLVLGDDEAAASALSYQRYQEMVGSYQRLKKRFGR